MPSSTHPQRRVLVLMAGRLQSLGRALKRTGSIVALLTFVAVCADSALVPELNTVAPAVSCGLFLLLMLRRRSGESEASQFESRAASLATWRVFLFIVIHLAIIMTSLNLRSLWHLSHPAGVTLILSAAKYLILLPTAVLLPVVSWLDFCRTYRAECVAAAIALSFYPYKIFTMAWPWYGQALGRAVSTLSHPFVSSIDYVSMLDPTLQGPILDVTIVFGCGGLQGIRLFQILFMLIVVVDWNALNRRRAVAAYFGGLLMMLMTNAIRIALLFTLGNTGLQNRVLEYHLSAGWILFALAFMAYLLVVYRWLLAPGQRRPENRLSLPATTPHGMLQPQKEQERQLY